MPGDKAQAYDASWYRDSAREIRASSSSSVRAEADSAGLWVDALLIWSLSALGAFQPSVFYFIFNF